MVFVESVIVLYWSFIFFFSFMTRLSDNFILRIIQSVSLGISVGVNIMEIAYKVMHKYLLMYILRHHISSVHAWNLSSKQVELVPLSRWATS